MRSEQDTHRPRRHGHVLTADARYTTHQIRKALDTIRLGRITKTTIRTDRGRSVYAVISSSGDETYFATSHACTCPAGLHGRRCYHQLAVTLVA